MTRSAATSNTLTVGWAVRDITPDKPALLDGQFRARLSERVHDPLTVTALALAPDGDSGADAQAILVSSDMVGIPFPIVEEIRERLAGRTPGFDPRHLILHATHTHTAMVLDPDKYPLPDGDVLDPAGCRELFVSRAVEAAVHAWQNRKPGGVSRAYSHAVEQARAEIEQLEAEDASPASGTSRFLRRNRQVLSRYEEQKTQSNYPVEFHVLRLGDVAFATNPFELFLDYGLRIKARSVPVQLFLTQITCGYDGYLPTAKAMGARLHAQDRAKKAFSGNYGAGVASNRVGSEGGQVLVDRTVACVADLFTD